MNHVGIILIGRNEAVHLPASLAAAAAVGVPVVYVDSGSTDQSLAIAADHCVNIVNLDTAIPFSAARARNEGVQRLVQIAPEIRFVQFVDADCQLDRAWLPLAVTFLQTHGDVAVACGRRREAHPNASIYNRLIDMEWNTPIGDTRACGGDAMFRLQPFNAVGGFDPSIVAGEEPQLCNRLRAAGWKIYRLDADMTVHDADIHHFSQWWQRDIRTGYGSLDVASRFADPHFAAIVRRARLWGLGFPMALILITLVCGLAVDAAAAGIAPAIFLLLLVAQLLRLAWRKRGLGMRLALIYAFLTMLGKPAQLIGQFRYRRDRAQGRLTRLIEYKSAAHSSSAKPASHSAVL